MLGKHSDYCNAFAGFFPASSSSGLTFRERNAVRRNGSACYNRRRSNDGGRTIFERDERGTSRVDIIDCQRDGTRRKWAFANHDRLVAERRMDRLHSFGGGRRTRSRPDPAVRRRADDRRPRVENAKIAEKTKLWLVRADGKGSVLLDECLGVMTAAAWRPDGTSIAYGKLTLDPKSGAGRFAVVSRGGPDRERTLWSIDLADPREISHAREATLAWSPDGKTLVAPRLNPEGLVVIRIADGKVLKQLDAASMPSWNPAGDRLAFQRSGAPPTIELIDTEWGVPRRISDLFVLQPPTWTRDGDALLVLAPKARLGDKSTFRESIARRNKVSTSEHSLPRPDFDRPARRSWVVRW